MKPVLGGMFGLVAALGLQVGLSRWVPSVSDRLDLLLIVVVYYGVSGSRVAGMISGAAAGLLQDVWFGALLGSNGFRKVLIGYLVGTAGLRVALDSVPARGIALLLAVLVDHLTGFLLGRVVGWQLGDPFSRMVLERAVATALVGSAVFAALGRFVEAGADRPAPAVRPARRAR